MKKTLLAVALAPLCLQSQAFAEETPSDEVMIVTANRFEQSIKNVIAPVSIVTKEEIDAIQAKSLTEVLRRLPGIQVTTNGSYGQNASVFIRGTNSNHLLVLINGVRIGSATTGAVNFGQLPLTGVERIEYIRGSRAAVYGADAVGGVINIISTYQPNEQTGSATAGIGSDGYVQTQGAIASAVGESGWAKVAVNYEQADGYNISDLDSGVWGGKPDDKDGMSNRDIQLDVGSHLSDSFKLGVNFLYHDGEVDFDYTSTSPSPDQSESTLSNISSTLQYQNDLVSSTFIVAQNRDRSHNFGNGSSFGTIETERTLVNWNANYQLNQAVNLGGGVDWYQDDVEKAQPNYDDDRRDNTAVFVNALYDTDVWQFEGSVRTDDNDHYGRNNTWQLGAGWRFIKTMRVTAMAGTAYKVPTFNDMYWPGFGNPDLVPEESENYELALEGNNQLLDWRVAAYDNQISNQIQNQGVNNPAENADVHIKGIEITASFVTSSIYHDVSLDLMDHEDESDGKSLVRRADESFKWNASYLADKYQLDVSYLYQGDSRDTYSNPATFAKNEVTLDSYHLVDFAANYFLTDSVTLRGRIANVLDEDYQTAYGYVTPERSYFASVTYQF